MSATTKTMARFWAKVNKVGPVHPTIGTECWLWTGRPTPSGYGAFFPIRTEHVPAHRYSYVLAHGIIPDGLHVLHKCDVRLCVRPDHLFAGTQLDNVRDMLAKGREGRTMKKRTHCVRGHVLADNEVRILSEGKYPARRCRECKRIESAAYYAKNRDRVLARQIRGRTHRADVRGDLVAAGRRE